MESYELSLCSKGYYGLSENAKIIFCTASNEICPYQRYCSDRLVGIHTSMVLACKLKQEN